MELRCNHGDRVRQKQRVEAGSNLLFCDTHYFSPFRRGRALWPKIISDRAKHDLYANPHFRSGDSDHRVE
jgi:hypothetical protein